MYKSFLSGQRVLLLAPRFFGYEREIISEMECQGALVDWLPDRPFDNSFMAAITKLRASFITPFADRLYERLLDGFAVDRYDIVFVINGQTLSNKTLNHLRKLHSSAKFIMYIWDSIKNRTQVLENFKYFDSIYTFDSKDAANHGILFRPLFYGKGFKVQETCSKNLKYRISFVGTVHTDRYYIIDKIRQNLDKNIKTYFYLYLQAPWVLHYYRLTKIKMRNAKKEDFKFEPLDKERLQKIFTQSLSVLDIEHPSQTGLTMRTFEALGAGKKLITTNKEIQKYDFYNENNICLIDRSAPKVPKKFLETQFVPMSDELLKRYSISGWLKEILN
jgi:hypothetical protein